MATRIATGDERDRIWAHQIESVAQFAEIAATTEREVPVVVIEPISPARDVPDRAATRGPTSPTSNIGPDDRRSQP